MVARETEGDLRDQKVEDVSVPEDRTTSPSGRMQSPAITCTRMIRIHYMKSPSGESIEYRGAYNTMCVYVDDGCVRLCSDDLSGICLGPNGIRDKRLEDEILEGTPDLTDTRSLPMSSG